jgi:LmbE family N-acetylglucosaminyl deacetylase
VRVPKRRLVWVLTSVAGAGLLVLAGRQLLVSRPLFWANVNASAPLALMAHPAAGERVLIFAPHEDDETLGTGGLIQQATEAGADVSVVLMTNGENQEVSVVLTEDTLRMSPAAFERLGMIRQRETLAALELQGLGAEYVTFLGYPDHTLDQMWQPEHWTPDNPVRSPRTRTTRSPYPNSMTPRALHCGAQVLADVETVLGRAKPAMVICPDPSDIHPDHWATGAFVQYALQELAHRGEPFAQSCRLYRYLVHRDHWPVPRGFRPWLVLEPPAHLVGAPELIWHALPLSLGETLVKHRATTLYHSQGGGYDRLLLAFARVNELYASEQARRWSLREDPRAAARVEDPATDLNSAVLAPSGNITSVSLARDGRRLRVALDLRGRPSPRIAYNVGLHAGGGLVRERVLARYNWRAGRPQAMVVRGQTVGPVAPSELDLATAGTTMTLEAPWPFVDQLPAYVQVKAWTTRGRRPVDQTRAAVFTLPLAGPAERQAVVESRPATERRH